MGEEPQTRFRISLRSMLLVATFAGIVFAVSRHIPVVLVFFGFVGIVVLINILLNALGAYPHE